MLIQIYVKYIYACDLRYIHKNIYVKHKNMHIGEMLISPKPVKYMDCVSNGLDTATTYDIIYVHVNICKIHIYM
jgi:hypothetical protein